MSRQPLFALPRALHPNSMHEAPFKHSHAALVGAVVLVWASNFVVVKWGLARFAPLSLCAWRFVAAAIPGCLLVAPPRGRWALLACFGALALVIRGFEFPALNCQWDTNAYGSMIWAMLILHTGHLLTEWVETLVMIAFASSSRMEGKRFPDFDVNSDYWYFVVGWAIVMNFVLYWVPRFL